MTVTDAGGLTSSKSSSVTVSASSCGGTVLCSGTGVALPAVSTGGVSSTYSMPIAAGKTVTFTIRQGVKFNNGTPMTPADVAFTYNLIKNNASINLAGLQISSVSTSGNTVTLTFPAAQYTNLQSIAGVPILPAAIWSKVGNPATYADPNPVGTGPYKLKTFTPQGVTLTKNPSYWQA